MSALKEAWQGIRKPVFVPASIVIVAMIVFSVVYAGTAEDAFGSLNSAISDGVGWWYILTATGFVIFALYCGVSRVGNIRLGRDDEQPEFGMLSWFAMLFSAGMGIGLVFYGVAEPLSHYVNPPVAGGGRWIHGRRGQSSDGTDPVPLGVCTHGPSTSSWVWVWRT